MKDKKTTALDSNAGVEALVKIITNILLLFVGAWYFMLGVGVAHAHLLPALEPIGYGDGLLVLVLVGWGFKLLSGVNQT